MNLKNGKKHFFICSLIQSFIFIPFLIQGYIGSDWDSYALIGTVNNYIKDSLERKIASVTASIEVLENQITRDKEVEVTN